jgi:mono/diheme cytochrome c family protein
LIAALALLPVLLRADQSITDDRVLRVQDGSAARQYAVGELATAIGLVELEVAKDPHFGPDRVFAGFALGPLLAHIGLGDAPELLLVCSDGYRIALNVSALSRPGLRALLAIRDTALPADGESHWAAYRHGADTVSFDPFYLVWASNDENADLGTETLPWPFQLSEIHRFDRSGYFAPARPPVGAGEALQEGFRIYTAHCGKCHRMRDVGGDVGPALDRGGSVASVLTTEQLRDYVRHDGSRYPHSKMPQFSKLLRPAEIDEVVAYLQAMQPGDDGRRAPGF